MAGKLSFSIAINLLTENFKRGTNQVKNSFRSMQAQMLTFAAALGAGGIGMSNLVSRFVEVARETSRVTTSLKNVSGSMSQFADNQKFLIDLAKKYGLEINNLTGAYAKFTAAASISGMSMEDQRKIFDSVSRACTAFGMSADDSNGVFLALSQMMSKGKISSEELRLQMGERLPIALQAMAKAVGVSVKELDGLMKQGKLMSKDVLPGFAKALNEMIPTVDTDNLETSVNRLKNTFTEAVNNSGVQSSYKTLIDWLTGAIQTAAENIKNILVLSIAAISGVVFKGVQGVYSGINAVRKRANEEVLNDAKSIQEKAGNIYNKLQEEQSKQAKMLVRKQTAGGNYNSIVAKRDIQAGELDRLKAKYLELQAIEDSNAVKLNKSRTDYLRKSQSVEKLNLQIDDSKRAFSKASIEYEKTSNKVVKLSKDYMEAKNAAIDAGKAAKAISNQGRASKVFDTLHLGVRKLKIALKGLWSAYGPMLLVTAVISLLGYLKNLYDEAKRVKNIFSEYKKTLWNSSNTQEVTKMQSLLNIMNDRTKSQNEINSAQSELQRMLGKENLSQEELNKLVKTRISLLREAAMAEAAFTTIGEYTEKNAQLSADSGLSPEQMSRLANIYSLKDSSKQNKSYYYQAMGDMFRNNGVKGAYDAGNVDKKLKEFVQNLRVIEHATNRAGKYQTSANKINTNNNDNGDPDNKKTELQKLEEKHAQSIRELTSRREVEKMTLDEYNKAYDELKKNALIEARSSSDKNVLTSEYIKELQKAVDNPLYGSVQAELTKVEAEYKKNVELAKAKLDKKLITEDEYRQSLIDASIAAANSAISIDGIGNAADDFIKKMQGVVGDNLKIEIPKLKQRDTTFDYKKTDIDKQYENVEIWIELRDNLKDKLAEIKDKGSALAISMQSDLNNAIANVTDFEKALKIAQVKQDIKDLSKEIGAMKWDGIKSAVSGVDSVVSSFERLKEAFDPDSEADGWERLMALWNSMASVVDGIMSVIETIKNITELTNKLTEAKQTEQVIDEEVTASKVTNKATETTAEVAAITAKTTAETTAIATQTTASLAASTAKTTADTIAMAAASTAAYAAIPFAGPALAAAQIATMKGMIMAAAIPFAKGGIITDGPRSGDRTLARVNAGEMILNGSQQANLFDAINSGNLGSGKTSGVTIGFDKVRGSDIYLSLKNYMKSTGKKL